MAEVVVLDASALVEALLGTALGLRVRSRLRGCELHAPAHLDAEVLSVLGQLNRAGDLDAPTATTALGELATAPITRHPLAGLVADAWAARDRLRLVDALYAELSTTLGAVLVTSDAPLSRAFGSAELVSLSTS